MLLGVGVTYLLMEPLHISTHSVLGKGANDFLIKILPFALVVSGLIALFALIYPLRFKPFQGLIHAFSALVLGYYLLIAIFVQNIGVLIYIAPLLSVIVLHIFIGVYKERDITFVEQFTRYSMFLVVFAGMVIVFCSEYLPCKYLSELVSVNKGVSIMIWCSVLIPILILLKKGKDRYFLLHTIFFLLTGLAGFILAAQFAMQAIWDAGYLSFLVGIFAVFVAIWNIVKVRVDDKRFYVLIASFVWVALSCLFGIFAIYSSREEIKKEVTSSTNLKLTNTASEVVRSFENWGAVLTVSAGDLSVKNAIINNNTAVLTERAKSIYEKVSVLQRVIFYDENGKSVGTYPHLSIGLGTDYSEREYFQKTKSTYKGYISNVIEGITGNNTLIQTEPIFDGNRFVGMIGIGISLNTLSDKYQEEMGEGFGIQAVDERGTVVFASEKQKIGSKIDSSKLRESFNTDKETIWSSQNIRNPNWELYVDTSVGYQMQKISNINIIVTLLVLVNSIFAIGLALILSLKGGLQNINIPQAFSVQKTAQSS
jgi:hypothetical protein